MNNRDTLIRQFFDQGYNYNEIAMFMKNYNFNISVRHLKRILKKLNLQRKFTESPLEEISEIIVEELAGSGKCLGYKSMWNRLKLKYGLKVKRSTVEQILQIADPEGVALRARHRLARRTYKVPGPNFLWHLDGYDKLKPFGFAIHGGIDGFSRKLLWLEVARSNNNPKIISNYYLKTVKKLNLVPTLIRSDHGTENSIVEAVQQSLRFYHHDKLAGMKSFIKGKSTSNQRIESYWSQLRRTGADFWISLFKDMRENNIFNDSNHIEVECLIYCFGPVLKKDLNSIRHEWNRHKIRKQKQSHLPAGKPNCLFYLPHNYGFQNYSKPIDNDDLEFCLTNYSIDPKLYNDDFKELVNVLLPNVNEPESVQEALVLYDTLLKSIKEQQTN